MKKTTRQHRHVHYLCDKMKATSLGGNQVDIFPYQSNILRADLRTNNNAYDSINCKNNEKDSLTNEGYFQLHSQYLKKEQLNTSDSSLGAALVNSEITLEPKLLHKNYALQHSHLITK